MDLGIAGKVAFVSGGSKGIGRATAEILAREGCRVVIAARGQTAIEEAVAAITAAGGTAIGEPAMP
jgi:NAD(P)-dependent dehydrogenase (short-subunit alcohol dehydrogenase family)